MELSGKVAIITGGARGIGKAIAEELLTNGAKVCLIDVLKPVLSETETEFGRRFGAERVITCIADITQEDQFRAGFQQTIEKWGTVDILINNASIQKEGQWKLMVDINMSGTIRGTLLALEFMNPEHGGVVLNMSSVSGVHVTRGQMPLIPVYSATKAGIIAYTRCFALNEKVVAKKIRIVCLCPLSTETALLHDKSDDKCWDMEAFYSADRGRLMKTSEVASITRELLQDETNSGKVALIQGVGKYEFI